MKTRTGCDFGHKWAVGHRPLNHSPSRDRGYYERWLDAYLGKFRILDVDERTTVSYSAIRVELKKAGKPIPSNDMWIAALCRQHSLPLLSRDRHFDAVSGITRVGW